jgi:hypothetical protein
MAVLAAIPDTPETAAYVSYADLDAYFEALGAGSAPDGASNDEMNDWLTEVAEAERSGDYGRLVSGSQFAIDAFREPEAFRAEIGLDPADVRQSAETGDPPATLNILRGSFDAGEVDDAVHDDPGFSDLLEEAEHGGVSYYAWGEDFAQDFSRNSPVHTLGRGGRLALKNGLLFWCFGTEALTGAIDAVAGAAASLADRADFAAMAAAIDSYGAYSAQFTDETQAAGESSIPMLAYFEAVAAGSGTDGQGAFMVVAIANPDEQTASENVERLQSRIEVGKTGGFAGEAEEWATGIDSVEARADGLLTVAVLRGPRLPWDLQAGYLNEPFLLHEEHPA